MRRLDDTIQENNYEILFVGTKFHKIVFAVIHECGFYVLLYVSKNENILKMSYTTLLNVEYFY